MSKERPAGQHKPWFLSDGASWEGWYHCDSLKVGPGGLLGPFVETSTLRKKGRRIPEIDSCCNQAISLKCPAKGHDQFRSYLCMRQTARKMPHRIAPGSLQGRGDIPGQPVEVLFHLRMCAARVYHDRPRQSVAAVDTKAGRPVEPAGVGAVSLG